MLWFSVWLLLVLAMLGGLVVLARRLWLSGKALLAELDRAGQVVARLESLQAELKERFPEPVPPRPDIGGGPADRARFNGVREAYRLGVRRRRTARLDRALRHWKRVGSPL